MAASSFYGANYKIQYVDVPSEKGAIGGSNGRVKALMDTVTLTEEMEVNDKFYIGKLPVGAKVIGAKVLIPASLGTTGKVSLGHGASKDSTGGTISADPDAFVVEVDGGGQAALGIETAASAGLFKQFYATTDIYLTATEVSDAGTGLTIKVLVEFVLD